MIRKFKAFGAAAVAMLAMSAVVASAANAEFTSAGYPASGTATSTADTFTAFGSEVKCTNNSFSGTLTGPTNNLTINPTYTECVYGTLPATVNFTSCSYVFHGPKATPTVDVACSTPGDTIDILVYASKAAHTSGTPICKLTVGAQAGLSGHSYTNNANGTVTVSGTVGNVTASIHRNSFVCPGGPNTNNHTSAGTYKIQPAGIVVSGNNGAVSVH